MSVSPPVESSPDWSSVDGEHLCPLCDYNLRGIAEPRCPECGYRFRWEEIFDARYRLHPYLFEHHPERPVWSFLKTWTNGWRPRRFWTSLHPSQPARKSRLRLYWLICAVITLVCVVPEGFRLSTAISQIIKNCANGRASVMAGVTPGTTEYAIAVGQYGSVAAYADYCYPPPLSPRFAMILFRLELDSGGIVTLALGICLWPWLTMAALMVFRISMRRARIHSGHVMRCVIYSFDAAAVWGIIGALLAGILLLYAAPLSTPNLLYSATAWATFLIFALLFARLVIAYSLYLRFDHPFATVLASQVIVLLVYAKLMFMLTGN